MLGIKIPLWIKLLIGVALLTGAWMWGRHQVQQRWDESKKEVKTVVRTVVRDQGRVNTVIKTQFVDRIRVVKEKGDNIVKQVPVYISNDSCPLPGGFRVLHDAAATNSIPGPAEGTDAAEVPVRTATTTVVSNYNTCNKAIVNLEELRDWVVQQRAVYLALCKDKPHLCSEDKLAQP